jgi:isoleucyl-tRNA synthetase
VSDLILSEDNVKELELMEDSSMLVKSIKPNFKTLGKKYGQQMKAISAFVKELSQDDIAQIEASRGWTGTLDGVSMVLDLEDFEIAAQDIPGWLVASENGLTVALDITLTEELKSEGIARELVNRVQNLRKDSGFEVTDKITLTVETTPEIQTAIEANKAYIQTEVLANSIHFNTLDNLSTPVDLIDEGDAKIKIVAI